MRDKSIEWITMNGNHIPIKEGQTQDEAVNEFLKSRNDPRGDSVKELKEKQAQDLDEKKEKQKAKAKRSLTKRIEEHQHKIDNPQLYVKDWNTKSEQYKQGIVNYWKKEIINYENQIKKLEGE